MQKVGCSDSNLIWRYQVWDSRKETMEFYIRTMSGSEVSEHERYSKIHVELSLGMHMVIDKK